MRDGQPLKGETVVFTGTPKSPEVFDLVKQYGATPVSMPLIRVKELQGEEDAQQLQEATDKDWLIFTSQSAVASFREKMERHHYEASQFKGKIAAVGSQTARALEQIGFQVSFIPTVFSADVFVKQFKPTTDRKLQVLFLRGNLAGSLIREELPFQVYEWTVYETEQASDSVEQLAELIRTGENITVLFASPSAVDVFAANIEPKTTWNGYTIGAIGHVTERALLNAGAPVHVKPETYTLVELVHALAKRKEVI